MEFERGPEQTSPAFFESVGCIYLDRPQTADTMRLRSDDRAAPQDLRLDPAITMTALWNHERFGDWQGERDELARRLRRYGDRYPPETRRMLEFRLALLDEKLGGPDPLPAFAADVDEGIKTAAEMLRRQRDEGAALAVFYANMPARLFIDGREVMRAGQPERPAAAVFDLTPGRHLVASETGRQRYPDWMQLAMAGRDWFFGTDPSWVFAFNPEGNWAAPEYDDSGWTPVGGTGVKGPPEEPHVWVEPDPFLGMQSRALGIRPSRDWPPEGGRVVYRKELVVPLR